MTSEERTHYWHEQITAWQASGLSGMAFCKQHELVYNRFVYWRQKLDHPRSEQPVSAAGFARVTQPASSVSDGLTVALPNGVSITGLHAGNIELLGAIMAQL